MSSQSAPAVEQAAGMPVPRSRWQSAAGVGLMLLGGAFLVRLLLKSTEDLSALSLHLSAGATISAFSFLLLCFACAPLMWQRVLVDFGHRLSYRDAFSIYYVAALAKYVPGSVWGYVGMAHYGRRVRLNARTTVFSTLVQHAVVCGGSVLCFGVSLLLWPDGGWALPLAALALWVAGTVILLSPLPKRLLSAIATRLLAGQPPPRFTRRAMIVALFYFVVSWILFALGYYFLLQTFYPTSFRLTLVFTGIYGVSWLSGFLAVLSPSGLGVREGVQAYLLSLFMPAPIAVTIALVQRVWLTVGDLLTGLTALQLLKRSR